VGQEGGRIRDPAQLDAGGEAAMRPLAQVGVMAAIVATLLYFPFGLALAVLLRLLGVSFEAFVTFSGALNVFVGLAAWWLLFFTAASVYAACLFPWGDKVLAWPKKK
jgi:hypothetical protein